MTSTPERPTDAIFGLLRLGLNIAECVGEDFPAFDEQEWVSVFRLSMQNHVAAVACDGVEKLPEALRPPRKVMVPWKVEREKAFVQYHRHLQVQEELIDMFRECGIPTLVLKGTMLSRYYPNPSHRPSSDIDLYHYERHEQADEAIRQLGIAVSNEAHHHSKYGYKGVTVESHYDFVNRHTPRSNKGYEQLLKSLDPASATFEALFLARHMSGHFASSRITLRNLCDWAMFLRARHGEVDWNLVNDTFRRYNMHRFIAALQTIIEKRLGMMPLQELQASDDAELVARITHDIIQGEFREEHQEENLGRLFWKLRRFNANKWKYRITYSDAPCTILLQGLASHLLKPKSLVHKM